MAELVWDKPGRRWFECGIDHGVVYEPDGVGVVWNGLTAVEEENNNEIEPVYFDGLKFNDIVTIGEYAAVLKAFTYPEEVLKYDGYVEDQLGVLIADQVPRRFHLSYRTIVGNDLDGTNFGYKIHIVYNCTANAQTRNWETLGLEVEPLEFEWAISAIPEDIPGHRPTAHIILDTRKIDPWLLEDLEDIIYGNEENDAILPPLSALITFIRKWNRLIIEDHGDGTWSAISQDDAVIMVQPDGYFEIYADDDQVVVINPTTYQISSSEKNDEDIYP